MRGRADTKKVAMPTRDGLERSAQWHLSRRALTEAQLRKALLHKLSQARRAGHVFDDVVLGADIDNLIERYRDAKLLDDERVAGQAATSMRTMGKSSRIIAMKLRTRGVDDDTIAETMIRVDEDDGGSKHADLLAARIYVRKRKLKDKDPQKALAALGRQGFSFDVAKRALAGDDDDD